MSSINPIRFDLNPYLTGSNPVPTALGISYQGSSLQKQNSLNARLKGMKFDRGFLGANAFFNVLEENYLGGFHKSVTNEIDSLFFDRGIEKISKDKLNERYQLHGFEFKRDMTERRAQLEIERHQRRQYLQRINSNYSGNDLVNKVLFTAPTLLGGLPDEILAAGALATGGVGLGLAGSAVSATGISALSKGYKFAKLGQAAYKTGRVLKTAGSLAKGQYTIPVNRGATFLKEAVHDGIFINGVSSVGLGISEYSLNSSLQEASSIAGENFLIGMIATPATFAIGRGIERGGNFLGDQIRGVAANKVMSIKGIADNLESRFQQKPKLKRRVDIVDNEVSSRITNIDDTSVSVRADQIQSAIELDVDPQDIDNVDGLLEAAYQDADLDIQENAPLVSDDPQTVQEFVDDLEEVSQRQEPEALKEIDIDEEPSTLEDKADLKQKLEQANAEVKTLKEAKALGELMSDYFETPEELVNALSTVAYNSKVKTKNKQAKVYASLLEAVENSNMGDTDFEAVLQQSPADLLTEYNTKPVLKTADPDVEPEIRDQSAEAETKYVQQELPFVDQEMKLLRENPNLVERMVQVKEIVSSLEPEQVKPFIDDLKAEAGSDSAVVDFLESTDPETLLTFLSHLDDENVSSRVDNYLNCKQIKG